MAAALRQLDAEVLDAEAGDVRLAVDRSEDGQVVRVLVHALDDGVRTILGRRGEQNHLAIALRSAVRSRS